MSAIDKKNLLHCSDLEYFDTTRTIYSTSENSGQFLKHNTLFNFLREVSIRYNA